ncbi:hypothetical protein M422DRAFT_47954 [Sphaerobolus stellatus SS14]|uniref:Unplaced genomic scaffold SPHSTscaffold_49, whole genome shotgun sequence n=1 Tax=Sphaerobolus stellatus (strain SS14) TaxID=990650 RepID=A0A0C9UJW1_SPHS4|nr:hypothetical protein M422DRAFT_47954 [Sphaerobolus stellatus SS14]
MGDLTVACLLVTDDSTAHTIMADSFVKDSAINGNVDVPTSVSVTNPATEPVNEGHTLVNLQALEELEGYQTIVDQLVDSFSPPKHLEFQSAPDPETSYISQFSLKGPPNTGPFALKEHHAINSAFLDYEMLLCNTLEGVEEVQSFGIEFMLFQQKNLRQAIYRALKNVDDIKAKQWNHRRMVKQDQVSDNPDTLYRPKVTYPISADEVFGALQKISKGQSVRQAQHPEHLEIDMTEAKGFVDSEANLTGEERQLLKARLRLGSVTAATRIQLEDPVVVPVPYKSPQSQAVLGKDTIFELNRDIARTRLPSWTAPGAKSFYASEHVTLSADEWCTVVLIRFVVTLPRIWDSGSARHKLMLENFMHLANAMVIANTREVIIDMGDGMSTAKMFREEYGMYLQGRVDLYPTAKIQPTEHLAYHMGDQMEGLGPMPSRSTNAFERFNGMLQDTPTNMRSGTVV